MSTLILGANSIVQHSIPQILHKTDKEYYKAFNKQLEMQAENFMSGFRNNQIPGLQCIEPKGAMYCMVKVDATKFADIKDAFEFTQKLLLEEFVFVLPGACFRAPGYFRAVFLAPKEIIKEAVQRIKAFCDRHRA
uniref:Aminotransferase class I/classII large domain-containing protein n=2 Tax=Lotharella globosa TaxID=91324 RepID=A0A7S3Z3Q0_9EUKA